VGCWPRPSPALMIGTRLTCAALSPPILFVTHHDYVRNIGGYKLNSVLQSSPLMVEENSPAFSLPSTDIPKRWAAAHTTGGSGGAPEHINMPSRQDVSSPTLTFVYDFPEHIARLKSAERSSGVNICERTTCLTTLLTSVEFYGQIRGLFSRQFAPPSKNLRHWEGK